MTELTAKECMMEAISVVNGGPNERAIPDLMAMEVNELRSLHCDLARDIKDENSKLRDHIKHLEKSIAPVWPQSAEEEAFNDKLERDFPEA